MTQGTRIVPREQFGEACLEALLSAIGGIAEPVVGLPTGNTPVGLFESLRTAVERGEADVRAWRPFAIDEYGGPREHPCSNRAFFARYWDVIPGAPPVEQFEPEAPDLARECARMEALLRAAGGLDVALLGIGMNGHLAFNEPGSTFGSPTRRVALHQASRVSGSHCWGDETPAWGLTLGLRELLGAPSVIVMANGAAKASVVAAAINGPESTACPASFLRRAEDTLWVLDEDAAALLRTT